ncbi:Crp/Fnr family transcriptional regulator [Curvibacter sp. APW13]|uniref:Crp/Fnr family transcriptional regulator n=1 Tax=Curvibacter sp. APW13 TaxID=3077236 RepID=UPI0028DFF1F5|nr:Crp/Fnr family transcriptional regulator [Curvibacter sp. APW13]MDT8991612.1 Crp/Fnr family transcriptional regulator [Curvibacter sp. APW13]
MLSTPALRLERFLSCQPWFRPLPVTMQREVLACTESLSAAKGETVFSANEPVECWCGVVRGLVKIESLHGTQHSTFAGLDDGAWFGEGALLKQETRQYRVVALRDTELACLPATMFDRLLRESMHFNRAVIDELNQKLGQAMAVIHTGRTGSVEQRLALALRRMGSRPGRVLELSQDELASLAGMARQTANRTLKQLEQRGIVRLAQNRMTVLDDAALLACVQGRGVETPAE